MSNILLEKHKRGLWDNIWAKRRRGEKMRKPGSKGAPTEEALKRSQVREENTPHLNAKTPTPKQIAHKFKKPVEEIMKAISQGQRVEKEHTTNSKLAREIATDHVNERPDYYKMLKAAEKKKNIKEAFNDRRDIVDSLKNAGFHPKRNTQGGDHEIWHHPESGGHISVPRHRILSTGVAHGIIKKIRTHQMKEAFETTEPQSKDPGDASSRFDATQSAVDIYKGDTPGEKKIPRVARKIKSIVSDRKPSIQSKRIKSILGK
jgi:DNA-directed RNA polymerase subunit H (RpoH/RPB5)